MSTGLIIAIVVAALILIALFAFVLSRARRSAESKRANASSSRVARVAGEQRAEAEERRSQAAMAEQRAQMAESEAKRERAETELRAQMHEGGMADHELVDASEHERFAGTSAAGDADRPMQEPVDGGRFARQPETERTDDPSRPRPV
jgi:FtsZ-interacting cell division protein ZipA